MLGLPCPARGGHSIGPDRGGQAVAETNVEIGQRLAELRGWIGKEFECLYRLWSRESGWDELKWNRAGSGAYGIGQALPASKMAPYGADYMTSALTQVRWGLAYIAARFGSPCGAWQHSQAYGWY